MGGYLGSYLYQVDEKGRITLPAAFRRDSETQSFVLIQAQPDALTLYPDDTWEEVQERLRSLVRTAPRSRHRMLGLTANAVEVIPDKQGRILIPDRLRAAAGIRDEAQVVGAIDKIEIWDPESFSRLVDETGDDFGDRLAGIFA
ncbi:MAG: cell division/cell wall cluster transcriptional repressor MraZ [Gemmatimonadetes bacterium]|nr:cell division/cell wall cluster transcriptional repressor MraZ [Gemmatimonadota bacterium]NNK49013.1 cell division/cell wall cluster transcriptional repressor MraZ [Gemmatimonadota bacterium]